MEIPRAQEVKLPQHLNGVIDQLNGLGERYPALQENLVGLAELVPSANENYTNRVIDLATYEVRLCHGVYWRNSERYNDIKETMSGVAEPTFSRAQNIERGIVEVWVDEIVGLTSEDRDPHRQRAEKLAVGGLQRLVSRLHDEAIKHTIEKVGPLRGLEYDPEPEVGRLASLRKVMDMIFPGRATGRLPDDVIITDETSENSSLDRLFAGLLEEKISKLESILAEEAVDSTEAEAVIRELWGFMSEPAYISPDVQVKITEILEYNGMLPLSGERREKSIKEGTERLQANLEELDMGKLYEQLWIQVGEKLGRIPPEDMSLTNVLIFMADYISRLQRTGHLKNRDPVALRLALENLIQFGEEEGNFSTADIARARQHADKFTGAKTSESQS